MNEKIHTIIIGGGQAGLATSYYLNQRDCEHIILEQAAQAGNAWRNDRWDSFTLLTPNWSFRLPGAEYQGDEPDGFMRKAEIVIRFEQYVERYHLPIQYQKRVVSVEENPEKPGYLVRTDDSLLEARNIVIATGLFQHPRIPAFSGVLSRQFNQVHSGQYRNPQSLPQGAVLVIGSGQSGCQIAEELYQNGRQVYLCVGNAGRAPRRYRGKDVYEWLNLSGFLDRTVDQLPSPLAKFAANPQVSGRDGGHSLNLHQFVRDGVVLLGSLQDGRDNKIWLNSDLQENLARNDKFEEEIVRLIDGYIAKTGLNAPLDTLPELRDGYQVEPISELDLHAAGITNVIWSIGYNFDFSLVKVPVLDKDGYPAQKRGVTDHPGLYFLGLPWLYKQKSGLLVGVSEDAEYIASAISGRR